MAPEERSLAMAPKERVFAETATETAPAQGKALELALRATVPAPAASGNVPHDQDRYAHA